MDKVIHYGIGMVDIKSMKPVTHKITSINIDNISAQIKVVYEKGSEVNQFKISMEQAQEIGFINLNAIEKYIK